MFDAALIQSFRLHNGCPTMPSGKFLPPMSASLVQGLASIVIPTRNRADLIRFALESASAQSYDPIEIIVVDDAGADDTEAVVTRASVVDPRIGYVRNEFSRGCGGARNRGVDEARGEFLSFLDSDDLWHREKMRVQIDRLKEAPELDFVAGQTLHFCERIGDSPELWNTFQGDPPELRFPRGNLVFQFCATTWRRSSFDRVGRFLENLASSEDMHFFNKAFLLAAKCELQPMIIQFYRRHSQDQPSNLKSSIQARASHRCLMDLVPLAVDKRGPGSPDVQEFLSSCVRNVRSILEDGDAAAAATALAECAQAARPTPFAEVFDGALAAFSKNPECALKQLVSAGLDTSHRPRWWQRHLISNEPLLEVPVRSRYGRSR